VFPEFGFTAGDLFSNARAMISSRVELSRTNSSKLNGAQGIGFCFILPIEREIAFCLSRAIARADVVRHQYFNATNDRNMVAFFCLASCVVFGFAQKWFD